MLWEVPRPKTELEKFSNFQLDKPPFPIKKLFGHKASEEIFGEIETEEFRVRLKPTDSYKYARMLAKIAHCYAVARLGLGKFRPMLLPAIRGDRRFPLHFAVGGITTEAEKGASRHELGIFLVNLHGRDMYVVRIRLFSNLGWPEYFVIAGTTLNCIARPYRLMLEASSVAVRSFRSVWGRSNPVRDGNGLWDYLCFNCKDIVVKGVLLPDEIVIRCGKCGIWNVPYWFHRAWGLTYDLMPELQQPADPYFRAIWPAPEQKK